MSCLRVARLRAGLLTPLGAWTLFTHVLLAPALFAPSLSAMDWNSSRRQFEQHVEPLLHRHCGACHSGAEAESGLSLAGLSALDPNMQSPSAARWALVLEKLTAGEMPPADAAVPPLKAGDAQQIERWIRSELKRSGKHLVRRAGQANGNRVSHSLLFDSQELASLDAPPRIRMLRPEIYAEQRRRVAKGFEQLVSQPFSPNGHTTFRDMNAPLLDEPTTVQLIQNAQVIAQRQTSFQRDDQGKWKPLPGARKEYLPLIDLAAPWTKEAMRKGIEQQFVRVLQRRPDEQELTRFTRLMETAVESSGRLTGVRTALAAVFLLPEAIFRYELGGAPDDSGRVRLEPDEIGFALAYALTDRPPNASLRKHVESGSLNTDEGVAQVVREMLLDPKLPRNRVLRFFQEYFGYTEAVDVFKDAKQMKGHEPRALVADTDRLVQYILEQDKQVLRELLTTNKTFVFHTGAADLKQKRAEALAKFERQRKANPEKYKGKQPRLPGRPIYESYGLDDFPDQQPVELPRDQRAGVLTQPSWLVAKSTADDNHAILRGKWIRERLLGGVTPDIPITVDAQLPDAPEKTLRQRMEVTQQEYCWQCHQLMNRLGLPFEMYDHFGRYRTEEPVVDLEATAKHVDKKGKPLGPVFSAAPVDATGGFEFTMDAKLTGDVDNAIELVRAMAKSERVEQVFVRHAFRYWMGRNETLGDAATLRAAHRAYRENEGSMRELLVSLLSSESFLYRMPEVAPAEQGRK